MGRHVDILWSFYGPLNTVSSESKQFGCGLSFELVHNILGWGGNSEWCLYQFSNALPTRPRTDAQGFGF